MSNSMIIAGQKGQGVTVAGTVLAHTSMAKGQTVTVLSCENNTSTPRSINGYMAVIAEEDVTLDNLPEPGIAMVFDNWALEEIEPLVKKGGILFVDTSCVTLKTRRKDINLIKVPARETAKELGNSKMANMVLVGALKMISKRMITPKELMEGLKKALPGKDNQVLAQNEKALLQGEELYKRHSRWHRPQPQFREKW